MSYSFIFLLAFSFGTSCSLGWKTAGLEQRIATLEARLAKLEANTAGITTWMPGDPPVHSATSQTCTHTPASPVQKLELSAP